jgi:cytochrome c553
LRALAAALALACVTAAVSAAGVFEERRQLCLDCHGKDGVSKTENTPSLGGMPEQYVLVQLYMFRERLRKVQLMNDMAKGMTDDDLRAFSQFIAKLPPPPPPAEAGDPARMARAKVLADKHRCNVCHNPDFSGHDQLPRLRNQREDYLLKTLREYKSQKRTGYDAAMLEVLVPLSDPDLVDLAHYLAHVR